MSEQTVEWNPLEVLALKQSDETGAGSGPMPAGKLQKRPSPSKSPAVMRRADLELSPS